MMCKQKSSHPQPIHPEGGLGEGCYENPAYAGWRAGFCYPGGEGHLVMLDRYLVMTAPLQPSQPPGFELWPEPFSYLLSVREVR
mgnify:CR=1 FL=1